MDNEKTSEDGGDSDAATVGRDLVQPRRERRNPTRGLLLFNTYCIMKQRK
jgi:hypothetical protein